MTRITDEERKAAVLRAFRVGVPLAAQELKIKEGVLRAWRDGAIQEPWGRKLRNAAFRLAERIGYAPAAKEMGINSNNLAAWLRSAHMTLAREDKRAKKECVECGELMSKPGLCSEECRQGWIESGGEA